MTEDRQTLTPELRAAAETWRDDDPDPVTRAEVDGLLEAGDHTELAERFGTRLEFGTAGLRGLMGAGPNRMNRALVRRVTAGLAAYVLEHVEGAAERGVVVGYDARHHSLEFAREACGVLAGAGIRVHVFPGTATTPRTAFTCHALNAAAAVVVTASHNPPEYNGYKVYWENAAQIIPPHDRGISATIDRVGLLSGVPVEEEATARERDLWRDVPADLGSAYLERVAGLCVSPQGRRDFGIVYTPLHGVGAADMEAAMAKAGFQGLRTVPAQAEPDGDFPTVSFPNPEEPGAMDLALEQAEQENALLVLGNDPDADRLAVAIQEPGGGYRKLSGNAIGAMLGHYLLTRSNFSKTPLVCTTIVSSSILSKMAADLKAAYAELLTGFKWIANKAMDMEATGAYEFVFGFEEALGYTVGDLVRDKDGVGAGVVFADMVGWCLSHKMHPLAYLDSIYTAYGYHAGGQRSLTLPGQEGSAQIQEMMTALRQNPPGDIAGSPVVEISDLQAGVRRRLDSGKEHPVELPASNVLRYLTENGTRLLVRPSGTEPKIKFYVETVTDATGGPTPAEAQARVEEILSAVVELVHPSSSQ